MTRAKPPAPPVTPARAASPAGWRGAPSLALLALLLAAPGGALAQASRAVVHEVPAAEAPLPAARVAAPGRPAPLDVAAPAGFPAAPLAPGAAIDLYDGAPAPARPARRSLRRGLPADAARAGEDAPATTASLDRPPPTAPAALLPPVAAPVSPARTPEPPAPAALAPAPPPPAAQVQAPPPLVPTPSIAEALRPALAAPARGDRLTPRERAGLLAAYEANGFAPLLTDGAGFNARARAALERLARADEDALDPARYRAAPPPAGADAAALAAAEARLVEAALLYARDARGGRVAPTAISKLVTAERTLPEAAEVLAALAGPDPGGALHAFHPPHPGYRLLRARLAELRRPSTVADLRAALAAPSAPAPLRLPRGPDLRAGMSDALRVPLLRAHLGVGEGASRADPLYDEAVAAAVAAYQRAQGLPPSGRLGPRTAVALAGGAAGEGAAAAAALPPARLVGEVIANMERWRWLPRELGAARIEVNIPDYELRAYSRGAEVHRARVIVGKPATPTPVFSDRMRYLIVNPSWFVPPSILKAEFLPGLAADPDYAAKRGFEVTRRGDNVSVRQPPGERNALGNIKFMFPNSHAVYLHDTPSRALFGRDARAFSHGCVRVDQPMKLAEAVLSGALGAAAPGGPWTEGRVRGMVGRGERTIPLAEPLPVHLTYFTLSAGPDGALRAAPDLYGLSAKVRAALGV